MPPTSRALLLLPTPVADILFPPLSVPVFCVFSRGTSGKSKYSHWSLEEKGCMYMMIRIDVLLGVHIHICIRLEHWQSFEVQAVPTSLTRRVTWYIDDSAEFWTLSRRTSLKSFRSPSSSSRRASIWKATKVVRL